MFIDLRIRFCTYKDTFLTIDFVDYLILQGELIVNLICYEILKRIQKSLKKKHILFSEVFE